MSAVRGRRYKLNYSPIKIYTPKDTRNTSRAARHNLSSFVLTHIGSDNQRQRTALVLLALDIWSCQYSMDSDQPRRDTRSSKQNLHVGLADLVLGRHREAEVGHEREQKRLELDDGHAHADTRLYISLSEHQDGGGLRMKDSPGVRRRR